MLDKITWPAVALVTVVLGAVVALSVVHADTSVILTVLVALGVGGIGGMVQGVKSNVNGNLAKLTDLLASAMEKLAQSPAIPPTEGGVSGQVSGSAPDSTAGPTP